MKDGSGKILPVITRYLIGFRAYPLEPNDLSKWGSQGSGDGEFYQPAQIAVDSLDNVYVSEGGRIQKFGSSGNFLAMWWTPIHYYIAVDSADHVLIGKINTPLIKKYASGN